MSGPGRIRRWKTLWVAALVLLGVAVTSILIRAGKEEVRMNYVGLSPTDSYCVVFAIINTSPKPIRYSAGAWFATNRPVEVKYSQAHVPLLSIQSFGTIPSGGTITFTMPVWSPARWSSAVMYDEPPSTHSTRSTRERLVSWADAHNRFRLYRWLKREGSWRIAYGPEMFGDKPMAAVPK